MGKLLNASREIEERGAIGRFMKTHFGVRKGRVGSILRDISPGSTPAPSFYALNALELVHETLRRRPELRFDELHDRLKGFAMLPHLSPSLFLVLPACPSFHLPHTTAVREWA